MESEQGLSEAPGGGATVGWKPQKLWSRMDAGTSDVSGRVVLMVAETERSWETAAVKQKCERDLEDIGQGFQMGFSSVLVINHPSCIRDF